LTLLLRQANGAFWLALFFPAAVCLGVEWLAHKFWGDYVNNGLTLIVTLIVYSILTYALGLRLFLKRQDVAWGSGDVTIPLAPAWLARRATQAQPGRRFGALSALLYKELHLQQVNLLCGVLFVLLFAGVVVAKRSDLKLGDIFVHEILLGFFFMIWALMPFLIGAVTIAEERRLGILEWQQSLPVSRFRQFLAKWLPACALSVLLAAVLPWLLDALAYVCTGESVTGMMQITRESSGWKILALACLPALAAIAATTIGLFASSLVRNLLQALSLMVGLVAATWALVALFLLAYEYAPIRPVELLGYVGLPTLLVVLGWLAFRNYCEAVPGRRLWQKNLTVLLVSYACILGATAALYARAWEVCLPEPRLGKVHLTGPATPRILWAPGFSRLIVLLPSGTLWQWGLWEKQDASLADPPTRLGKAGAWKDVAATSLETVGIQTDGTLWRWNLTPGTRQSYRPTEPEQIGTDRDWQAVTAGWAHFAALKTDGSLWKWEPKHPPNAPMQSRSGMNTLEDNLDQPARSGTDTDWMHVVGGFNKTVGVKRDGSAWEWDESKPIMGGVRAFVHSRFGLAPPPGPKREAAKPDVGATPEPEVRFGLPSAAVSEVVPRWRPPQRIGNGTNWLSITVGAVDYTYDGIQSDGSLWYLHRGLQGPGTPHPPEAVRVGDDADWLMVSYGQRLALGLKKDGSLWSAEAPAYPRIPFLTFGSQGRFVRKSSQGPWIAVAAAPQGSAFALAADGSLWTWGWPLDHSGVWLIPPSNRPHLVARLAEPESR